MLSKSTAVPKHKPPCCRKVLKYQRRTRASKRDPEQRARDECKTDANLLILAHRTQIKAQQTHQKSSEKRAHKSTKKKTK
jgi:hypothetical protein